MCVCARPISSIEVCDATLFVCLLVCLTTGVHFYRDCMSLRLGVCTLYLYI